MNKLTINLIENQTQLEFVMNEVKNDMGRQVFASHSVFDGGEFIAALHIIPTVLIWLHRSKNTALSSYRVLTEVETLLADKGDEFVCVPCEKTSPCYEYMERLGYLKLENHVLFVKGLK